MFLVELGNLWGVRGGGYVHGVRVWRGELLEELLNGRGVVKPLQPVEPRETRPLLPKQRAKEATQVGGGVRGGGGTGGDGGGHG